MYHNYRRVASFSCFAAFLLFAASNAFAGPGSGGNCAGCHSDDSTGGMNISGNTGTLSVNPRLDLGGSTAQLPLFIVTQGQSVPLTINVTDGGTSNYAFAVTGTLKGATIESLTNTTINGIKESPNNLLGFIADSSTTWVSKTPVKTSTHADSYGKTYYATGSYAWTGSPDSKTFNLGVSETTPPDVYTMTLRIAGTDAWSQSQEVLVQVLPQSVPEPSTIVMMLAAGAFALVVWRRKK